MARTFRMTPPFRVANAAVAALLRRGVPLGDNALLTVPGRRSGLPRTTPIAVLERDGERFLQSPYGEVDWVRNLRAAGHGTLTRGRRVEPISVVELSPAEAAPVFKATLSSFPALVRGSFDVSPDAPLEAFEREAPRHPMFRVVASPPAPR